MRSDRLTEYAAYYRRNPRGDEVICMQIAVLASLVANMFRGKGRESKPYEPKDFYVVDLLKPREKKTPQQLSDYFRNLTKMMGGEVKSAGNGHHQG